MRVRVNGSTDIFVFSLYDELLGEELIFEFLETHCAFVAEQFIYIEEEDLYACEEETFDKWQSIIEQQSELSRRIKNLKVEHGDLFIGEIINKAFFHSIEDEAEAINYELDRALD